jgi:hypothetical protein
VPAGAENKGGKAQPGCGLPHLLGWLEDVGTVLGPQVVDGLAAQLGVWLVPDRHVAADQLPGSMAVMTAYAPDGCGIRPSCMSSETWS